MVTSCYCADIDTHIIHAPECPEIDPNATYVQIKSKVSLESFLHLGFKKHGCMENRDLGDLPDMEQYPFPSID